MITVNPAAPSPPYEQIRLSVLHEIRTGGMATGDRLPTVRKLAADLGLAPNTVARAYRELEQDHVVETRGRHGTFVAAPPALKQQQGIAATSEYVATLRRLGIARDEAVNLLQDAYRMVRLPE